MRVAPLLISFVSLVCHLRYRKHRLTQIPLHAIFVSFLLLQLQFVKSLRGWVGPRVLTSFGIRCLREFSKKSLCHRLAHYMKNLRCLGRWDWLRFWRPSMNWWLIVSLNIMALLISFCSLHYSCFSVVRPNFVRTESNSIIVNFAPN